MKDGLWVIMMCQRGFADGSKCTALAGGMLTAGELVHVWEQEIYGNVCIFLSILL